MTNFTAIADKVAVNLRSCLASPASDLEEARKALEAI
jgi:hypothetical protein